MNRTGGQVSRASVLECGGPAPLSTPHQSATELAHSKTFGILAPVHGESVPGQPGVEYLRGRVVTLCAQGTNSKKLLQLFQRVIWCGLDE